MERGFDPNSLNPKGEYALMVAIKSDAFKAAAVLIANPQTQVEVRNAVDESPLMLAALKGNLALCEQLMARDADVNKPGWAPLHYAASTGSVAVIEALLDNHAYIDAESPNGSTPLMMAALYGTPQAVASLLDHGADPTLKNTLGLNALDFALKSAHPDSVDLITKALHDRKPKGHW